MRRNQNALDQLRYWGYTDDMRVATFLYDACSDRDDMDDDERRTVVDAADVMNDVMNDVTPLLAASDATHRCDSMGDDPMYSLPYAECAESGYRIGESTRHDWYGVALQVVTVRDMKRILEELARIAPIE